MDRIAAPAHLERKPVAAPAFGITATFFIALGRSLARFFANVAVSQDIIYRHEDGLSRLPDDVLAARGLDREEIRRAIKNSRIGF